MTGWQPIATAPRDGRWLLILLPAQGQWPDSYEVMRFCEFDGEWHDKYGAPATLCDHIWQPLPPPPETPMSNPIKVALEAGVLAYASLPVEENPRRCARVIAAFLRALAPPSDESNTIWCLVLAAAVEAAARGESNTSPPSC